VVRATAVILVLLVTRTTRKWFTFLMQISEESRLSHDMGSIGEKLDKCVREGHQVAPLLGIMLQSPLNDTDSVIKSGSNSLTNFGTSVRGFNFRSSDNVFPVTREFFQFLQGQCFSAALRIARLSVFAISSPHAKRIEPS
jgi:hypothetical protein